MNLQDIVRRLEEGSRIPEVDDRQRTIAWVRFFSEVERLEREQPDQRSGPRSGAA